MAGIKTRVYNGTITRDGKLEVFTIHGASMGTVESIEEFFEKRPNFHLIQVFQPDPVRTPSKLRIIVEMFDVNSIDFAAVEKRFMDVWGFDPGNDAADAIMYAYAGNVTGRMDIDTDYPLHSCPTKCPRFERKPGGRRTKPVEKLYYARVVKDDVIKFDTKLYSRNKMLTVLHTLKHAHLDCIIKVFEEDGNPSDIR